MKQFYRARKESPPAEINKMDEVLLSIELQEYLKQTTYVVVFDDVWTQEFWSLIRHTLRDIDQGSRVLITTHYENIAFSCKESSLDQIYKLQPLPEEKALELFCQKDIPLRHRWLPTRAEGVVMQHRKKMLTLATVHSCYWRHAVSQKKSHF